MVSLPSNATFSGFPKNKQACKPHHKLLTVIVGWVYPTDDVRAERPWHRGLRRVPLCLPRVWCVPLNCHWKCREGADPGKRIEALHCDFMTLGVIVNRKEVHIDLFVICTISGGRSTSVSWVTVSTPLSEIPAFKILPAQQQHGIKRDKAAPNYGEYM